MVLELTHEGCRYIAKAGDEDDQHLEREQRAYRFWLQAWTSAGRAYQVGDELFDRQGLRMTTEALGGS